jgi:uncharacterized SAM-binding protein YcdF (DUF218 family)
VSTVTLVANGRGRWLPRQLLCLWAGALLIADALFLMARDIVSLGVTLPLALGIGLFALGLRWPAIQTWLDAKAVRRAAWRWAWLAFWFWLLTLAVFWSLLARTAIGAASGPAPTAIIVLGSGTPNGKASPALAARLDLAREQAARHPAALIVVSGGLDFSETTTEAQIMGDYLRARGVDPQRIVQEDKSTSTIENLRFSRAVLAAQGVRADDVVQVVTSDFHTMRAGWIARNAGYTRILLAGSPTPLYVRYNAWLREYFAALAGLALREFG